MVASGSRCGFTVVRLRRVKGRSTSQRKSGRGRLIAVTVALARVVPAVPAVDEAGPVLVVQVPVVAHLGSLFPAMRIGWRHLGASIEEATRQC